MERARPRRGERISAAKRAAALLAFAATAAAAADFELPDGPGRELVYARCRTCHDLQYVVDSAGIPQNAWATVVEDMGRYGLRVPNDERDRIAKYLATYLGPNAPKPAPAAAAPAKTAVDGGAQYQQQCSACHQPDGRGVPGNFPPLAENPDLFLARLFPVYVALNGLEGEIAVKGAKYQGVMPPFGHLSDEQIAAIVNFVRGAWGNAALRPSGFKDVDAAAVAEARKKPMKPAEVRESRKQGH
ncbi:MAG TPA: c-type cytochrome [Burkholderiales bacterium]|nr:c-type cytochrome [Burkholderiales bacterium]